MPYCGDHTLVKFSPDRRAALALRCRSWNCPDCCDQRRDALMAIGNGGSPDTFLTLTIRRSQATDPIDAAKQLARAWRVLRLRALREAKRNLDKRPEPTGPAPRNPYPRDKRGRVPRRVRLRGEGLPFLAVFERHKSGWPHLHILLRCEWFDYEWASAQMVAILNSPIVDVRRVQSKSQSVAYVAKYVGKDPHKFGNCKRYWRSPDFDLRPKFEKHLFAGQPGGWDRVPIPLAQWAHEYVQQGWTAEWLSKWEVVVTRGPP